MISCQQAFAVICNLTDFTSWTPSYWPDSVTTNSVPWVWTSHSADRAAPSRLYELQPPAPHDLMILDTPTCHDGRQINTWKLKPTWGGGGGLCGWRGSGDGSEGGKYEVCVLTGGEMTKAEMMSGCYYCWHSAEIFHRREVLLRSPADSSRHHAAQIPTFIQNMFNPAWNSSAIVDSIWQNRFFWTRWSILQRLHWTDLTTPSKPWLGTGKDSRESNSLLKPRNHVPIHQCLSQSREAAKTTPTPWGWWEAKTQAGNISSHRVAAGSLRGWGFFS